MNAQEKAAELLKKFRGKHHATICVDEIMKVVPYRDYAARDTIEQIRSPKEYFTSYWGDVKQEINNFIEFKIKWLTTGRIEILEGYTLRHAFIRAGLKIWYKKVGLWKEIK